MSDLFNTAHKIWVMAEVKSRLSEVLRLVKEEGPQNIGTKKYLLSLQKNHGCYWHKLRNTRALLDSQYACTG